MTQPKRTTRSGPVTSDDTRSAQMTKPMREPGFRTVDDLSIEESSKDLDPESEVEPAPEVEPIRTRTVNVHDYDAYPWVVRFAVHTRQDVEAAVAQAREDEAPKDAVTKKSTGWVTYDQVHPDLQTALTTVGILTA